MIFFLPVGHENNWFRTVIFNSRTVEVLKLPRSWEHIPVERWLSAAHSYSTCSCSSNILRWPKSQSRFEDMRLWESLVWSDTTNLTSLRFNSCWIHQETDVLEVEDKQWRYHANAHWQTQEPCINFQVFSARKIPVYQVKTLRRAKLSSWSGPSTPLLFQAFGCSFLQLYWIYKYL